MTTDHPILQDAKTKRFQISIGWSVVMSSDPPPPRRLLEQWIEKRLGESNAAQFMLFQPSPGSPELRDGKLDKTCALLHTAIPSEGHGDISKSGGSLHG